LTVGLRHRFYLLVVVAAYWLCALWLLFKVFPIYFDDGGPMPTFSWANHPSLPTYAEYNRSIGIRLAFFYPYLVAASIIAFLGCGLTTWLVRLWRPIRSHLFLAASATTLFSLLLAAAMSDVGTALHIWRGPMMYGTFYNVFVFLKVMVPVSLLGGLVALVRNPRNTGTA